MSLRQKVQDNERRKRKVSLLFISKHMKVIQNALLYNKMECYSKNALLYNKIECYN